ncbi:hypothetical protein BDF14DRAFT_1877218 [Spinellus fusiger]|nr:hypothetical protein BDF14DRAFT_1877218 [Spinellus fusiger]
MSMAHSNGLRKKSLHRTLPRLRSFFIGLSIVTLLCGSWIETSTTDNCSLHKYMSFIELGFTHTDTHSPTPDTISVGLWRVCALFTQECICTPTRINYAFVSQNDTQSISIAPVSSSDAVSVSRIAMLLTSTFLLLVVGCAGLLSGRLLHRLVPFAMAGLTMVSVALVTASLGSTYRSYTQAMAQGCTLLSLSDLQLQCAETTPRGEFVLYAIAIVSSTLGALLWTVAGAATVCFPLMHPPNKILTQPTPVSYKLRYKLPCLGRLDVQLPSSASENTALPLKEVVRIDQIHDKREHTVSYTTPHPAGAHYSPISYDSSIGPALRPPPNAAHLATLATPLGIALDYQAPMPMQTISNSTLGQQASSVPAHRRSRYNSDFERRGPQDRPAAPPRLHSTTSLWSHSNREEESQSEKDLHRHQQMHSDMSFRAGERHRACTHENRMSGGYCYCHASARPYSQAISGDSVPISYSSSGSGIDVAQRRKSSASMDMVDEEEEQEEQEEKIKIQQPQQPQQTEEKEKEEHPVNPKTVKSNTLNKATDQLEALVNPTTTDPPYLHPLSNKLVIDQRIGDYLKNKYSTE